MPKKKDDNWVDTLIKIGIGALAVYFLAKLLEGGRKDQEIVVCPNCGTRITKWARQCPNCRTNLMWQ